MIRALALSVVLALLALPACFAPVSGDYTFHTDDYSSDCPESDTGGGMDTGDSTSAVSVSDDKATMTIGEGESATDCDLSGRSFTCPTDPFVFDASSLGYDAVSTTTFDISGHWTGNTSFETEAAFETSCDGADCETLSIPSCSGSGTGSAELAE